MRSGQRDTPGRLSQRGWDGFFLAGEPYLTRHYAKWTNRLFLGLVTFLARPMYRKLQAYLAARLSYMRRSTGRDRKKWCGVRLSLLS